MRLNGKKTVSESTVSEFLAENKFCLYLGSSQQVRIKSKKFVDRTTSSSKQ